MHGAAAAKTLLLKASQLHPVAINALFALCVLGLRHSDMNLVTASLQEMEKYQGVNPLMNLDQHLPDITSLRQVVLDVHFLKCFDRMLGFFGEKKMIFQWNYRPFKST